MRSLVGAHNDKKALWFVVIAMLALCGAVVLGAALACATADVAYAANDTTAANTKNMKQLGVKFDLKKNKTQKFTVAHAGCKGANYDILYNIRQPFKAKVTSLKVKKAKKKGYKQATITIKSYSNWKPSQKAAKAVWYGLGYGESYYDPYAFGSSYVVVMDYKTGVNLEKKNAYGVTVKVRESNVKSTKKYYIGSKKNWLYFSLGSTLKLTITYPSSYKDLCVGVGGTKWTVADDEKKGTDYVMTYDYPFFKTSSMKLPYTKTSFFKKSKDNFHFMRIK